ERLRVVASRVARQARTPKNFVVQLRRRIGQLDSLVVAELRERAAETGVARIRHRHRRERVVYPVAVVPELCAREGAVSINELLERGGHSSLVPALEAEVADLQDGKRESELGSELKAGL